MKKIISVIICVSVFCCCLPFLASAATPDIYSNLPKPYPDDSTRYFVIDLNGAPSLYQISAAGGIKDVYIYLKSNIVTIEVVSEIASAQPTATVFNLYTGDLRQKSFNFGSRVSESAIYTYSFGNFNVTSNTVKLSGYGCIFGSGWNLETCNVVWNDETDPSTYTSYLSSIKSKLNELDSNTDGLESSLSDIYAELDLFYKVFNAYQGEILADMTIIESQLDDIHDKLDSFSIQNHDDLMDIYDKLDDIYDLLNEEASTYAPVEQEQQINDYVQSEEALNKDYSGDLQNQFDVAGNVFENNNAFSFLSVMFQRVVLNNTKINGLVIFALALGLCVLVLGRKINA